MGMLIATVASILISAGISVGTSLRNKANKVSAPELTKAVNDALHEAQTKGNGLYEQLVEKLASIPNISAAPALKSYLMKISNDLNRKTKQFKSDLDAFNQSAMDVKERKDTYSYQNDDYKNTKTGKKEASDIKEAASTLGKEMTDKISSLKDELTEFNL